MAQSCSFDRAASFYDQTRGLPGPFAQQGIQAIAAIAGAGRPDACILEVGAGTGRISVPLLERGLNVIGCDLSREMMRRLHAKEPSARLAQADASRLPFPAGRFDAVLTFHVMHLVGAWREALSDFRRVLRPGGAYINSWNWRSAQGAHQQIRGYWRKRVEAHGAEWRRPGLASHDDLLEAVRAMGAAVEQVEVARAASQHTPRETIECIAARVYSDSWEVPEAIFQATVEELTAWAGREYGGLDRPHEDEHRFILDIIRFGAA